MSFEMIQYDDNMKKNSKTWEGTYYVRYQSSLHRKKPKKPKETRCNTQYNTNFSHIIYLKERTR